MPGLQRFLSRLVPAEPGEASRLWFATAAAFLAVAGVTIGRNVRDSLFLKNFGAVYLPYMYAGSAVVLVACSAIYARFVDRVARRRFLAASFLLYGAAVLLSRALLEAGFHWFYPVFYMAVQAIWALSVPQVWAATGEIFNIRQAKRLFPFVAAGGLLGMAAVGLIVGPAVDLLGTLNLLLLWLPCLAGAGICLRRAYAAVPPPEETPIQATTPSVQPRSKIGLAAGFRLVREIRLLRAMMAITLTMWFVAILLDYQFSTIMTAAYPTADELTAFLGKFRGWAGFASVVLQILLTPWLIGRFGAGRTVLIHPVIVLISVVGVWLSYSYPAVIVAKLADHLLLFTVQESSFQLLYNALPESPRGQARRFIDGYFKPVMSGAAGLLLIGANVLGWAPAHVSLAMVFFGCWWTLASYRVDSAYLESLLASLAGPDVAQRRGAASALGRLKGRESLAHLFAAIRHAGRDQALLAIQFLERFGQPEARAMLSSLVAHPDAAIRATAVAALGRLRHPSLAENAARLLSDPDARVRANTLEALTAAEAAHVQSFLRAALDDPHPRVRANAIRLAAAGIRTPEPGPMTAEGLLAICRRMCADPNPEMREGGAYALGGLPAEVAGPALLELLSQPAGRPWRQALRSVAEIGDESAVENILQAARLSADARHDAYRAINQIHTRRPGPLMARLLDLLQISGKAALRPGILMALGRIGDPAALPALAEPLDSPDAFVRARALTALERLCEKRALPPELEPALRSAARQEIAELEQMIAHARCVAANVGGPYGRLLAESLWEEASNIQARILRAIGLLSDRGQVAIIAKRLGPVGQRRPGPGVLEALEYRAGPGLGGPLARALEEKDAPPVPLDRTLATIAAHPVTWLRACVAYVIGETQFQQALGVAASLRQSSVPMVRQAALYSLCRLAPEDAPSLAERAGGDPHPAVRACAERILGRKHVLLTVEKVLFLKSVSIFASLGGEELARIAEIAAEQELPPGAVVIRENDDAHNLYVIVRGRVRVVRGTAQRERTLAELGERECFGEMALLDDEPRSASVVALDHCLFLELRGDDFRELILERPQISFSILRLLTRRLRQMDVEVETLPAAAAAPEYVDAALPRPS